MEVAGAVVAQPGQVYNLALLGGKLCLDFANTIDPRYGPQRREFLTCYSDLVDWARHVGVVSEHDARHLAAASRADPAAAGAIFERAIALRETIYRIFLAPARGGQPAQADLEMLLHTYAQALASARLVRRGAVFALDWMARVEALDRMLWPVAQSALELLGSRELERVRECPGLGDCGWLFLDTSKNGSRRWCSMEGCGSRAKMRRQYARRREAGPGTEP
jgi:predicted RNA-binding Zn ribbon-like protein